VCSAGLAREEPLPKPFDPVSGSLVRARVRTPLHAGVDLGAVCATTHLCAMEAAVQVSSDLSLMHPTMRLDAFALGLHRTACLLTTPPPSLSLSLPRTGNGT